MKTLKVIVILFAIAGMCLAAFSIPWRTLDGGGGKSTGTSAGGKLFSISGTIGQFDAQAGGAGGGKYSLNGGYWAQIIGDNPNGPMLVIVPLPNGSADLQWQSNATGSQLQSSPNLTVWTNLGGVITGAGNLTVTPTSGVPKQFFRLQLP